MRIYEVLLVYQVVESIRELENTLTITRNSLRSNLTKLEMEKNSAFNTKKKNINKTYEIFFFLVFKFLN